MTTFKGKRQCYWADESYTDPDRRYLLIKVVENESGYSPIRAYDTLDMAKSIAGKLNEEMGLTDEAVTEIRISSMRQHNIERATGTRKYIYNLTTGDYQALTSDSTDITVTVDVPEAVVEEGNVGDYLASLNLGPYENTDADTSAFAFKFHDQYGAVYEPWTDGHSVGFKVTRDGQSRYLSISPSIGSDALEEDTTCAFIREGETPETDEAWTHFDLFGSEMEESNVRFTSVNEDGVVYDHHKSVEGALAMLRRFPNDIVVISVGDYNPPEAGD